MLSIDEATSRERNLAEIYRNDIVPKEDYHNMPWISKNNEVNMRNAEEHDQLVEWLEELKAYREIGTVEECKNSVLDIQKAYNKTIDDFANWLVEQGILGNRCISDGEITDYGKVYAKKYKEQLKEA